MRIAIGTDHGGFEEKNRLVRWLAQSGRTPIDCGTHTAEAADYPIFAGRVAQAVSSGMADLGIILCKSGNGMCMVANRHPGIRAGIASRPDVARLAREHNNANILVLGAEHMGGHTAEEVITAWLDARFDAGGRHERRVGMMQSMDEMLASNIATHKLVLAGQAPWLDDLSEELVASGRIRELASRCGVRGVTSNPSIFQKSISSGKGRYPERLAELKAQGAGAREAYDAITIADVAAACDEMRFVFDATGGDDGRVSYEVEPRHAMDEDATVAEAIRLREAIGRPNLFIKIPATGPGLRAIRRATAEGISVNVTLMFSLQHYEDVARAYIAGLRDRLEAGQPVHDARGVASVFISRIDAAVNARLEKLLEAKHTAGTRAKVEFVRNKVAIANARRCYRAFQRIFYGPEFADLLAKGAVPQRPLWASTGVKERGIPEHYYIERLVAPWTVNTMPMATLESTLANGRIRPGSLFEGEEEGEQALADLAELGIGLDAICAELQDEGVRKFAESFDLLFDEIGKQLA